MRIKRVTANDDLRAITQIYISAWKEAYRGIIPQDYLDTLSEKHWSPIFKASGLDTLVIMEGKRYVGVSSFGKSRDEFCSGWGEVVTLYILPDSWGRGYGFALFNQVIQTLRKQGFENIFLWVLAENSRSRGFYERCGLINSLENKTFELAGKTLLEYRYILPKQAG
ncbi:MAG: GNAT family N-acetyltransferase [Anaerolineae bacterium]|nr:GNAT family N-acetyltransferase [Anaerolineae bacterium]